MPDLDDMLGGLEEPTYQETEKKGAPKIDAADLEGLLGDEPAVWDGNAQKRGAPVLDEQVMLDEPEQEWQKQQTNSVTTASALDAAAAAADLLGDEQPAAYDPVTEFCTKLQFDENLKQAFINLDAEKQMQVVRMRAEALGIPAPMIPNELRPKAAAAPPEQEEVMLEEAPQTEAYVPNFRDEDLERAKEEAKKPKKYEPPPMEMSEEQKRENRRLMAELREQREREQAKKGFQQLIILAVIGIIGAVAYSLFFSDLFGLGNKLEGEGGLAQTIKSFAGYVGIAIGIASVASLAPVPSIRSICKFLDIIGILLLLVGGIPLLMQSEGNGGVNGILFAVALITCGFGAVTLITNDNIHMYNKYGTS